MFMDGYEGAGGGASDGDKVTNRMPESQRRQRRVYGGGGGGEDEYGQRIVALEIQMEQMHMDMRRQADSLEEISKDVKKFTLLWAGARAQYILLGLIISAVVGLATVGDRILAFLHLKIFSP